MHERVPSTLPIAFLAVWAITCVCTFLFAGLPAVFEFAYFVLPLSALIAPLCFAHAACQLARLDVAPTSESKTSIPLSAATVAVGFLAYGLSASVVARFLELPWRAGKFGEASLDLGKSAAQFYAALAILAALSAFALFRAAPTGSRCARYAIGSLGMLLSASIIYILFGISPLVQWRA